ncbi:hypothetical protein [Sphingomonas bacterium]|uniref:hypothetical protein n=1 Tax=Sphingomonas bacterium TaxID=1895847 RepID=UPI0015756DF3|nr:hypothetical protein [Sphingomonas bacterium]
MPTIIDEQGVREVDADELAKLDAAAEKRWTAFWSGLIWRPIAEYDRDAGQSNLLRAGDRWAFGFWGPASMPVYDEAPADSAPAWRDSQESMYDVPLAFDPTEFAEITDHWRAALMAD